MLADLFRGEGVALDDRVEQNPMIARVIGERIHGLVMHQHLGLGRERLMGAGEPRAVGQADHLAVEVEIGDPLVPKRSAKASAIEPNRNRLCKGRNAPDPAARSISA